MTLFWIKDPTILLNKYNLVFWPTESMSMEEKLNAITRLVLLLTIAGFILMQNMNFIWVGMITLLLIVIYYNTNTTTLEQFEKQNPQHHTVPTAANPMMNVLLPEINGNPKRKSALKSYSQDTEKSINQKVKQTISKNVDPSLFKGINNEIEFEYSMRNFYTTANTTIPNDQEGFGEFCYGTMISAKEGDPIALARHNPRLGST
jgi:hypothetical protein